MMRNVLIFLALIAAANCVVEVNFNNYCGGDNEGSRTTQATTNFGAEAGEVTVKSTFKWKGQKPLSIDIHFPTAVLSKVHSGTPSIPSLRVDFPAPAEAVRLAGFQSVNLEFRPTGHPGFTIPHFDVHFFYFTRCEVDAIIAAPAECAGNPGLPTCCGEVACSVVTECQKNPTTGNLGPTLQKFAPCLPRMGQHWWETSVANGLVGGTSPEPFLVLEGSFGGIHNFIEPMVRTTTLQAATTVPQCHPIPTVFPAALPSSGYVPTKLCFRTEGPDVYMELNEFVWMDKPL